jgi:hypothetical protein
VGAAGTPVEGANDGDGASQVASGAAVPPKARPILAKSATPAVTQLATNRGGDADGPGARKGKAASKRKLLR